MYIDVRVIMGMVILHKSQGSSLRGRSSGSNIDTRM